MQASHDIFGSYSFDAHISEIRNKSTNSRVLLVGSDGWDSLQEGLYKKFSSGASVIILEMGISYGTTVASQSVLDSQSGESRARSIAHLWGLITNAGWGTLSLSGDLEEGSNIVVFVKNCVFCNKNHPNYPCNFLRGVGLGLATALFQQPYRSSSNCSVKEEHFCKIELQAEQAEKLGCEIPAKTVKYNWSQKQNNNLRSKKTRAN